MKKRVIIRFMMILMAILLGSMYYGVDLFNESSNDINFDDSLYTFDEFRDGDYVDFDMRNLKDLERIIVFPYYNSNTPLEEQKGIVVLSNEKDYEKILNSFRSFTMKSENKLDYSGDLTYVKMIIEIDDDNFYDISIINNSIDVYLNRVWFNQDVYYSDYNYEEFIRNELAK